jgi:hypothetical protein
MFRASSCPSSGATTTAVAASGLPSELGDSTATAVVVAPDDGHEDARNMSMMHGLANPKLISPFLVTRRRET